MLWIDQIKSLFRQLFPTGRAFRGPIGGWLDSLNNALAISENQAWTDSLSTFDSILADNANFTADDATDWERRLGLPNGTGLPLATRISSILQQYNFPGGILGRSALVFLQAQLRGAGFDVYVYQNRFLVSGNYVTKDPLQITNGTGQNPTEHGDFQHGDAQHGGYYADKVANSVDIAIDELYYVGPTKYQTFFVAGPDLSSPTTCWATVPAAQRIQLRQLILKLKPVHSVAYCLCLYV